MENGILTETTGQLAFLLTVMVFGCLAVLLALAGLLVFLLVKYQRQATFPMELLLAQDLPDEARAGGVISNAFAAGRVPKPSPAWQPGMSTADDDDKPGPQLMTTSQGMADARGDVDMGDFNPAENIL